MTDLVDGDDWLDDQLLADDDGSERGWQRRALGGQSVKEALEGLPISGQILVEAKIGPIRFLRAHIKASGLTQGEWMRNAVATQLLLEGCNAKEVEQWRPKAK